MLKPEIRIALCYGLIACSRFPRIVALLDELLDIYMNEKKDDRELRHFKTETSIVAKELTYKQRRRDLPMVLNTILGVASEYIMITRKLKNFHIRKREIYSELLERIPKLKSYHENGLADSITYESAMFKKYLEIESK